MINLRWWIVQARWRAGIGGESSIRRSFTDEAGARAYMAGGDPLVHLQTAVHGSPPDLQWDLTLCDPDLQPWLFSFSGGGVLRPGPDPRPQRLAHARLALRRYYVDRCDSALAFTWGGQKEEGPLTRALRSKLRRPEPFEAFRPPRGWFGMQLYKGDRTLYHLDDGCDTMCVADAEDLRLLGELGVEPGMLQPLRPGDTLQRADSRWTGG